MQTVVGVLFVALVVVLVVLVLAVRVVKQYEQGVLFRLGRVIGSRQPGLRVIVPFVDVMHRVSLRIITMPIQSQGIITRDNVSVDVSAVAYFRVVDAVFPAPLMSTIAELGAFLAKETAAAGTVLPPVAAPATTSPLVSALPAEDGNGHRRDPSRLVELGKF